MNELATKYDPSQVEDKWYAYWMEPVSYTHLTLPTTSRV